jgi:hypothetical protein
MAAADDMTEPPDSIPSKQLAVARTVSDALFGAKHRLPVAMVVATASTDQIYAAMLAEAAGTTEVQAGTELRHFERAGLLELLPVERKRGQRGRPPKRYARIPSVFWKLAPKLAEPRQPDE